jgi:hypothetical protein
MHLQYNLHGRTGFESQLKRKCFSIGTPWGNSNTFFSSGESPVTHVKRPLTWSRYGFEPMACLIRCFGPLNEATPKGASFLVHYFESVTCLHSRFIRIWRVTCRATLFDPTRCVGNKEATESVFLHAGRLWTVCLKTWIHKG